MKRPPSSGQHFWMGRSRRVGGRASSAEGLVKSGALGQGSARAVGASNLWMTSLHGPLLRSFGFMWRKSSAVPSSLMASRKLMGGLAFRSEPSSAATASTEFAPRLKAMRFHEPIVLMASGNGDGAPLTVGFSMSTAWPPSGFFISRSAISVISNSVGTGCEMRRSPPAFSRVLTKSRKESKAMPASVAEGLSQVNRDW